MPPDDWREIMADPSIDAVHITTPNDSHFPMAKAAFEAGKHVLCEKPLALTVAEARTLTELQAATKLRGALCHNLRYYPMVQQIRAMREAGELGDILVVQGTYSQDWMLYESDWNWRVEPAASGASRVMADIGSHFFDMAEHLTGLKVQSLCSDWQIFHPTRKRPKTGGETFSGKMGVASEGTDVKIETEDFGATLFRMGPRARGAMTASQVSAGRKNGLVMEIYGTKAAVTWRQEKPEELWIGHRDAPSQTLAQGPVADARNGARICGRAGRPCRRLSGYVQAVVPALLCLHRRSQGAGGISADGGWAAPDEHPGGGIGKQSPSRLGRCGDMRGPILLA